MHGPHVECLGKVLWYMGKLDRAPLPKHFLCTSVNRKSRLPQYREERKKNQSRDVAVANKRRLLLFFPSPSSSLHHDHKPPFQQNPTLKSARASDFYCTVNQIVHDFCSRQLFSLKINTKKFENPPIKPHTQRCQSRPHRIDGHLFFSLSQKRRKPCHQTEQQPKHHPHQAQVDFF